MSAVALIGGQGALPGLLAAALRARGRPVLMAEMTGHPAQVPGVEVLGFRLERIAGLLAELRARGISDICLAGAVARPAIDPAAFDADSPALLAPVLAAVSQGDDALLRQVIAMFERQGFRVLGAGEIAPDLLAGEGLVAGPAPDARALADADRAEAILAALGPLDLGQAAVVAGGLCLGIETLQGTDALLGFVAATPPALRRAPGVLVKQPKPGQDLRADMPAIGPATVVAARAAGLCGIVLRMGEVLILDRAATVAAADAAGIFVMAR